MYGKKYWVEIETVEQTPDTKVHHIDQSQGYNIVQTQLCKRSAWNSETFRARAS